MWKADDNYDDDKRTLAPMTDIKSERTHLEILCTPILSFHASLQTSLTAEEHTRLKARD
jgi:hypothetical protein